MGAGVQARALGAADRLRDKYGEPRVALGGGMSSKFREKTHKNPVGLHRRIRELHKKPHSDDWQGAKARAISPFVSWLGLCRLFRRERGYRLSVVDLTSERIGSRIL